MPITIEMLPNEPIIIARLQGRITAEDAADYVRMCVDLVANNSANYFRIHEVTDAEIAISDMLPISTYMGANLPASLRDSRFQEIFVGNSQTSRMYADILCKQALDGAQLPFFNTLDDALAFVSGQQAKVTA